MMLTVLAGIIAATLEILRKQDIAASGGMPQEVAGKVFNASHLSVLWQVPQFVMLGVGEVFTSITGTDL